MKKLILVLAIVFTVFGCSPSDITLSSNQGTQYVSDSIWNDFGSVKVKDYDNCNRILVKDNNVYRAATKNLNLSTTYRYSDITFNCPTDFNKEKTYILYCYTCSERDKSTFVYPLNKYVKFYEGSSTTLYRHSAYILQKNGSVVSRDSLPDGRIINYRLYKKL